LRVASSILIIETSQYKRERERAIIKIAEWGTQVTGSHHKVTGIHDQGNYTTIAIHKSMVSPRVGGGPSW